MKFALKLLLAGAWLSCMFWLIRHEAFPEKFASEVGGYKALVRNRAEISDTWMKIVFNNQVIGYSHGSVELNDQSVDVELILENTTQVQISLLGQSQRLKVTTRAMVGGSGKLKSFELAVFGAGQSARASGVREQGETYKVDMELAGKTFERRLEIPDDTVIFSPYLEMSLRNLTPGEELVMNVMDPLSLARKKVRFAAEARETVTYLGKPVPVTRVAVVMEDLRLMTWVDPEGRVMRQTTPFGWTMEACDAAEALAAFGQSEATGPAIPIPSLFSAPSPAPASP